MLLYLRVDSDSSPNLEVDMKQAAKKNSELTTTYQATSRYTVYETRLSFTRPSSQPQSITVRPGLPSSPLWTFLQESKQPDEHVGGFKLEDLHRYFPSPLKLFALEVFQDLLRYITPPAATILSLLSLVLHGERTRGIDVF